MLDRIPSPFYPTAAVGLSLAGMFLLAGVGSPGPDAMLDEPEAPLIGVENGPAASGDGSAEGIGVHGHWTIEVREPDGKLVTRREFENALNDQGKTILARLLTSDRVLGGWLVWLLGPCGDNGNCVIDDGAATLSSPSLLSFSTLSVERELEDPWGIRLSGTVIAQANGPISKVSTSLLSCHASVLASDCSQTSFGGHHPLTNVTLDPWVSVIEGQQILVTVRISFS